MFWEVGNEDVQNSLSDKMEFWFHDDSGEGAASRLHAMNGNNNEIYYRVQSVSQYTQDFTRFIVPEWSWTGENCSYWDTNARCVRIYLSLPGKLQLNC